MAHKQTNSRYIGSCDGFTLVELMVALAISGIVLSAVVTAFVAQKTSHVTQEKVTIMQQNIRAAMNEMTREIRMAAYDPVTGIGGITTAAPTNLIFTHEIDSAGTLQTIEYRLYDAYADGDTDIGIARDGAAIVPLAENIEALEFLYLDSNAAQTADLNAITTIQISILARAERPDENFLNTLSYFPVSCPQPPPPAAINDACIIGDPLWDFDGVANNRNAPNDAFRRRLLVTTVQLRN